MGAARRKVAGDFSSGDDVVRVRMGENRLLCCARKIPRPAGESAGRRNDLWINRNRFSKMLNREGWFPGAAGFFEDFGD